MDLGFTGERGCVAGICELQNVIKVNHPSPDEALVFIYQPTALAVECRVIGTNRDAHTGIPTAVEDRLKFTDI